MISVPSLLQPLNGSKFALALAGALLVGTSSCNLLKKAPKDARVYPDEEELDAIEGKRVYNPETGRYERVREMREPMDTIRWTDVPEGMAPPIRTETRVIQEEEPGGVNPVVTELPEGTVLKNSYRVSLVLPFLGDQFDPRAAGVPTSSLWAIQYYAGVRMALHQLEQEGVSLEVDVLDSEASESAVRRLTQSQPALASADLILGPYRRNNVSILAEFARKEQIPFVSPYSASSGLSRDNPYYLQANPTLETHINRITEHVRSRYPIEQVILVGKDNRLDRSRFRMFQEANFTFTGTRDTAAFGELTINDALDMEAFDEETLGEFVQPDKTTVFIVVTGSDETFVQNFLRMLDLARGEEEVVVYGMPQWMDFQNIDLSYFEDLNVHISSSFHLDPRSTAIHRFRSDFFDRYGTVPSEEAFLGYDHVLYFGRMLWKYGTLFFQGLEPETASYLHTRYKIEPVFQSDGSGAERAVRIQQYENKFVHILEFSDYFFHPAY